MLKRVLLLLLLTQRLARTSAWSWYRKRRVSAPEVKVCAEVCGASEDAQAPAEVHAEMLAEMFAEVSMRIEVCAPRSV